MKTLPYLIFSLLISLSCFSQQLRDTSYYKTENKAKSSFWGNSTYIASSVNFSRNIEFDFNIGRTNGITTHSGRGMGDIEMSTWGVGYGLTNNGKGSAQTVKAFYEYGYFPFLVMGNFGFRGEYIYNLTGKQHYLRPSAGLSIVFVDVSYNYSFLLNGDEHTNLYKHGLSIRLKYFLYRGNWQRNVFVRERR